MATAPSKRVAFEIKRPSKCLHPCPHLIYDEPYTFRVRSERSRSLHLRPCDSCLREAEQQQAAIANIQYQQRCSRLPPTPIDFEQLSRPKTTSSNRTSTSCNWDNFMKKRSKYAINTPYASCNLMTNQEDAENRPPFMNYGGSYHDKHSGHKRTFNSSAVHQLKHHEVDEERLKSLFRERHLHRQAENYFREMQRQKPHE